MKVITYYDADIFASLPSYCNLSLFQGIVETRKAQTYYFHYDNKNRIVKVEQRTEFNTNDWETDINITYNDADNVSGVEYSFSTGPRTTSTVTLVEYDDKPSPYTSIPEWRFIFGRWQASNPTDLIMALSKNNPTKFSINSSEPNIDTDFNFTYAYNADGFPTEQRETLKMQGSGDVLYTNTFEYECP